MWLEHKATNKAENTTPVFKKQHFKSLPFFPSHHERYAASASGCVSNSFLDFSMIILWKKTGRQLELCAVKLSINCLILFSSQNKTRLELLQHFNSDLVMIACFGWKTCATAACALKNATLLTPAYLKVTVCQLSALHPPKPIQRNTSRISVGSRSWKMGTHAT